MSSIASIGVEKMGAIADLSDARMLRLENLDVNIPPDPLAVAKTIDAIQINANNSYLPFMGKQTLRDVVARHFRRCRE